LGLDAHDDPGLFIAYAGKWETDDAVWAYRARQRAAALEAERRVKERRAAEERVRAYRAEGRIEVDATFVSGPHGRWFLPGAGKSESFKDLETAPEMVVIPAGDFWMGSKDGEGFASERPRHKVAIPRPFAVGRYPVTFAEWDAAVAAGGVKHKASDQGWGRGRRPVINVSCEDAQAYVKWLSDKTGKQYRLLSEAEWEYCCRAGAETSYSFGDKITKAEAQFSEGNWGSAGRTAEVGSFPANSFGLYDMHGNVLEWCQDCWNDTYKGAPSDGSAWTAGDCERRVLRGGSWYFNSTYLRSAYRFVINAGLRNFYSGGFRLARTL
jgi:formylglycine-generating enzyme required for sulfatase activity